MSEWQLIETIPIDEFVDIWVSSSKNRSWGARLTGVCKSSVHSSGWVGFESYYLTSSCKPTHWMPLPKPPKP